ncbi:carboxyl transferase domain-containing protein [Pseudonocardia sp. KRD291]|uniref:acetyl-CoA carboxylase family protein n=1 Tax=Pseudonocardia sp. KRD291 TaxID=2792007 RepID=UPI001C4A07B1|nr:carboxyl transferase domain-containing protein [Pseudonocardia sp. KRD291]MBW0102224.1 carbamoyl-phosphate synthase large subunit [Pseudonocardia sp. KRD291]
MFSRILIANRGEIAIRVARAAADLGVGSVAVYATDDAGAPHVAAADTAVALAGSGPAAYLDVDDVLRAAAASGADAVHPGYGFLSENAGFARACADRGVTFVGPPPQILDAFGDKTRARALAREAGLPVLAGTDGPVDADGAEAFRATLAAPGAVMLKALAGGGGRGMRRVPARAPAESDPAGAGAGAGAAAELAAAHARCASEALAAFGDGRVFAEELLVPARHVEVQIAGDGTGAVVALGERDCSIQRRHQKIVEIAPAPGLPEPVRAELLAAAVRLGESVRYSGLGTVEFLVSGQRIVFLEVNPRIQVEHTITEEVTGVDLVATGLRLAAGATLAEIGPFPQPAGCAVQLRITCETTNPDGTTTPSAGTLSAYELPSGRGIRVDGAGYPGYRTSLRYDPLLAKLIVHDRAADLPALAARAGRALSECRVEGVSTNLDLLAGVVAHPAFAAGALSTDFLDDHLADVLATPRPHRYVEAAPGAADGPRSPAGTAAAVEVPQGSTALRADLPGTVVTVEVAEGDEVRAGTALLVLEAMKMEHVVAAPVTGTVRALGAAVGRTVAAGDVLAVLDPAADATDDAVTADEVDLDHVRPDLAEVLDRHALGHDDRRGAAVAKRRGTGLRTARENLDDLCDDGTFVEYGALAIAAQRGRRSLEDLVERTPADGMLAGTATVNAGLVGDEDARVAVVAYDYTVLAGTQGFTNHRKKDRIFELARRRRLPVVVYAEGGGGRPGDTDGSWASMLDVPAFELFAKLSGLVPLVGVVAGRCFAGNAALAGICDVIIAVEGANLGMGGPAMIAGGGLGDVTPDEVGPMSVQVGNGVVDVLVPDEAEATRVAKQYLSYFQGTVEDWTAPDPRALRHVVPENRVRVYDMRAAVHGLADEGSVLELRRGFGAGMITALVRVEGRPMGLIANDPTHLGGAIDADSADKAARFLQLCDAFGLPVLSLCDTPGFMVGPESEQRATVRHFSRMFVVGANLSVPIGLVITRKCYGLGGQSMCGGDLKAAAFAVSWPTGELGGMGLEGAVRLGYRKELEAVQDPQRRQALFDELLAAEYEKGKALSTAQVFEIDDVIDPADTRRWVTSSFPPAPVGVRAPTVRPFVDTW